MSKAELMLKEMVGAKVLRIFMNENYLKFETDKKNFCFIVDGDCCSTSLFYDFYGVKKILGKVIKGIEGLELEADDMVSEGGAYGGLKDKKGSDISIQVYGYRITVEDESLGDVSAVFSFRNYSNGYYGGSLEVGKDIAVLPEIFDDVVETEDGDQVGRYD